MSFCKHQWIDRSTLLKNVFPHTQERLKCRFLVCRTCMMIKEIRIEREEPAEVTSFPFLEKEDAGRERRRGSSE